MENSRRLITVDLLKGLGILLMLVGHIGFSDKLNHYIYAFHMPLFFLMSGYVYRPVRSDWPAFVKKQFRSLMIPFFAFGICFGLLFYLVVRATDLKHLAMNFCCPNTIPFDWCGAVWFLMSLFIVKVLFAGLERLLSHRVFAVVSGIITIAGIAVSKLQLQLPLTLNTSLVAYSIYWAGFTLRKVIDRNQDKIRANANRIMVLCLCMVPLVFLNTQVNMRENTYGSFILFWLNMLGSVGLWAILLHKLCRMDWFLPIQRGLHFLSDHSIAYMVFNQILMVPFIVLVLRKVNGGAMYVLIQMVELSFVVVFGGILSVVLKKTRFRPLLGSR